MSEVSSIVEDPPTSGGNKRIQLTDSSLVSRVRTSNQPSKQSSAEIEDSGDLWSSLLACLSTFLVVITFPVSIWYCLKIVQQYERAVIFRLGRIRKKAAGPGLFFVLPCLDDCRTVDLRTVSCDVPPQKILSKDSVTITVDAVVFFHIFNATQAVMMGNLSSSTMLLAQTTLRTILGTKTLSEILSMHVEINREMKAVMDKPTDVWGVEVECVELKNVQLPHDMQRAMAAEAEAGREARAKMAAADGENKAANALRDASKIISQSPAALQLRYLQTLNTISDKNNKTIIFPFPVDLLRCLASYKMPSEPSSPTAVLPPSSPAVVLPSPTATVLPSPTATMFSSATTTVLPKAVPPY